MMQALCKVPGLGIMQRDIHRYAHEAWGCKTRTWETQGDSSGTHGNIVAKETNPR